MEWTSGPLHCHHRIRGLFVTRRTACRCAVGGTKMGFAWMQEDSRRASGPVAADDDTGWPYGRRGSPLFRQSRAAGRVWAPAGQRPGRHAQTKCRRPVLAGLTVARLQSLNSHVALDAAPLRRLRARPRSRTSQTGESAGAGLTRQPGRPYRRASGLPSPASRRRRHRATSGSERRPGQSSWSLSPPGGRGP